MGESLIVIAILVGLLGVTVTFSYVAPIPLMIVGGVLTFFGLISGVGGGVLYHVRLWEALRELEEPPADWYIHPTRTHDLIADDRWPRIRPWYYLGAIGFSVIVLGCLLAAIGAMRL